jgi:hypothetical protein
MMTQNTTYKRPNTVLTGTRAYQALADAWGVQADDLHTDAHRDAVADLKHWQELVRTVTAPNVYDLVLTTDRDSWIKTIKRQATDAVAAQLINEADARTEAALRQRIDNTLTNDEAWRHVATVLDVGQGSSRLHRGSPGTRHHRMGRRTRRTAQSKRICELHANFSAAAVPRRSWTPLQGHRSTPRRHSRPPAAHVLQGRLRQDHQELRRGHAQPPPRRRQNAQ